MKISRRSFIQHSLYSGFLATLGSGLFSRIAFAEWPAAAFDETEYEPALKGLIGDQELLEGHVVVDAPEIAENGATVPVKISTDLNNVEWISIMGDKNPRPWISRFYFHGKSKPFVSKWNPEAEKIKKLGNLFLLTLLKKLKPSLTVK